jgi:hypothetical protein
MRVKHAVQPPKSGASRSDRARDFATHRAMLRAARLSYLRLNAGAIKAKGRLPYDDDPEWNASFARSLDVLQRLADKAKKDYAEGRTIELDPDTL